MEFLKAILPMLIVIDILTIIFILKDSVYFFDEEKGKLILLVLLLPIVGAIYILTKLRDDIMWYVDLSVVTLALICIGGANRWDFYFCMKILGSLSKVLR